MVLRLQICAPQERLKANKNYFKTRYFLSRNISLPYQQLICQVIFYIIIPSIGVSTKFIYIRNHLCYKVIFTVKE